MLVVTPTTFVVLVIGVLIILVVLLFLVVRKKRTPRLDQAYIDDKKAAIERLIEQGEPTGYSLAIIEADKLLDTLLKMRHVPGTTLGERLKHIGHDHPGIRAVWPAHKMRNRIVHEHIEDLTRQQVKQFWKDYQAAYRILSR